MATQSTTSSKAFKGTLNYDVLRLDHQGQLKKLNDVLVETALSVEGLNSVFDDVVARIARGETAYVLRVPTNCVTGAGPGAHVTIVTSSMKDGKLVEATEVRAVEVGLRGDDYAEIASGVKEGEKIRPNPYAGPPVPNVNFREGSRND